MINRAQDKLSNPFEKWTASVDARSERESDTTESSPMSSRDIFVERYAAVILSIWEWICAFRRALFAFTRVVHAAKVTEGECITHAVNVSSIGTNTSSTMSARDMQDGIQKNEQRAKFLNH